MLEVGALIKVIYAFSYYCIYDVIISYLIIVLLENKCRFALNIFDTFLYSYCVDKNR